MLFFTLCASFSLLNAEADLSHEQQLNGIVLTASKVLKYWDD